MQERPASSGLIHPALLKRSPGCSTIPPPMKPCPERSTPLATDRPVSESFTSAAPISASEARFSQDGAYRWWLTRCWGSSGRTLLFLGLNPSRADGVRQDPTLRRLIGFARAWGYDALVVVNLFARVSPSPAELSRLADPIGPWADFILQQWCHRWANSPQWDLWCGWGNGGCCHERHHSVRTLLWPMLRLRLKRFPHRPGPLMLGLTRNGQPRHPLYASKQLNLQPFTWAGPSTIRHP